jgi:hypothetical protein
LGEQWSLLTELNEKDIKIAENEQKLAASEASRLVEAEAGKKKRSTKTSQFYYFYFILIYQGLQNATELLLGEQRLLLNQLQEKDQ